MEKRNQLDTIDLAEIDENELKLIQNLEQQLNGKYYIIALEKE